MLRNQSNNSIALYTTLLMSIMFTVVSCTTVKPYQRAYLNDAEMQAGKLDIEKFDENMQTYREGASGGGTGKPSGGCGCN